MPTPKTPPSCPFQLLLAQDLYQEYSELVCTDVPLMSPGILGTLSDPFQEVLPAADVFFGLGSALHGLEAP